MVPSVQRSNDQVFATAVKISFQRCMISETVIPYPWFTNFTRIRSERAKFGMTTRRNTRCQYKKRWASMSMLTIDDHGTCLCEMNNPSARIAPLLITMAGRSGKGLGFLESYTICMAGGGGLNRDSYTRLMPVRTVPRTLGPNYTCIELLCRPWQIQLPIHFYPDQSPARVLRHVSLSFSVLFNFSIF